MTSIHPKFDVLVERLVYKIRHSQTPVPGFVMGLSGTDSIVAFALCYEAMREAKILNEDNLNGFHYLKNIERDTWFGKNCIPWMEKQFPMSNVWNTPLGDNAVKDEYRWADLHIKAKTFNGWVVGTRNATEKALGKYSLLSTAVSLQPIQTLYKSTILEICEALDVPRIAIDNARIPDCLCGRDDFAAQNIELIDKTLRFESTNDYPYGMRDEAIAYIKLCKSENGFRERVPYTI